MEQLQYQVQVLLVETAAVGAAASVSELSYSVTDSPAPSTVRRSILLLVFKAEGNNELSFPYSTPRLLVPTLEPNDELIVIGSVLLLSELSFDQCLELNDLKCCSYSDH